MRVRSRSRILTVALAAALGLGALAVAPTATAAPIICDRYGSAPVQGGQYIVQNNRWGTSATQCIDVTSSGFTVTQADGSVATNGAPKSYPSIYWGCHYGNCSSGLLNPTGLQASDPRFGTISTSASITVPSSGSWNASYDIWFHRSQPSASTGQNDGAELMVWLNHRGPIQPIGSRVGTASVAGATWDVWSGSGGGWQVISYVRQQVTTSASFRVKDFWDDVVSRGLGSNSWYLTSIQAGFEPWEGGTGLAVNSFSVSTSGQPGPQPTPSPQPTRTATPTPQPTPTAGPGPQPTPGSGQCTATFETVNSWPGGFQANVTVRAGSSGTSSWSTSWSFSGGQSVQSLWNGVASGSGSSVSVRNAAHNGSLPANGTTSFGFVGSGNAPGSVTVSCAA